MDKNQEIVRAIAEKVNTKGGRVFFVGGYVRDALMNVDNKDIDIEVHGVSVTDLETILDEVGTRISIGESFGIYALKGYSIDIAMPRKEKLRGKGHKDFDVSVDPFIGTYKAAERRDFTINALMQDALTGEVVDHFSGEDDLKKGIIRHVNSESFVEDPLRVLRAAQFAARFDFEIAPETIALCKSIDLSTLSRERILGELEKALLKAEKPSIFFEVLRSMDQLDVWFPEVKALIDIPQNPVYHPEGDVWNHTMMTLDGATKYRDEVDNPLGFMLGALTHDFGKTVTTEEIDGKIHSYEHETKGLPIAEEFLLRITSERKLIDYVLNLVENHMRPNVKASVKSTNKMFDQSIDPKALIYISAADLGYRRSDEAIAFKTNFLLDRLEIYREYMSRPYVMGRDLIKAGLKPSKEFTEILEYAHKLRLAGVDKDNALKQTLAYSRTLKKGN